MNEKMERSRKEAERDTAKKETEIFRDGDEAWRGREAEETEINYSYIGNTYLRRDDDKGQSSRSRGKMEKKQKT